jgi:hypothetical protein
VLEPVSVALVLIGAALLLVGVHWRSRVTMFYLFVSFALYGGVWFVEAHKGSSRNSLMPVYAWTAVLFGVAFARLLSWWEARTSNAPEARGAGAALILGAAALQLVVLTYNPGQYVPPRAAVVALSKTVDEIRSIPGDVYVPYHSYDGVLAGKQPHAETEALGAVIDAHTRLSAQLSAEIGAALAAHRFAAIVTDTADPGSAPVPGYPVAISAPAVGRRFLTSQPEWFLFPCGTPPEVQKLVETPATLTAPADCGGR